MPVVASTPKFQKSRRLETDASHAYDQGLKRMTPLVQFFAAGKMLRISVWTDDRAISTPFSTAVICMWNRARPSGVVSMAQDARVTVVGPS